MKRITTILVLLLVVCSTSLCLFGCNNLPYNAVLYDSAVEWIQEDFKNENPIKAWGFMGDEDENDNPKSRTFIVCDTEDFEKVFIDGFSEFEVDFESEMIIVYTFGSEYVLPATITNMKLKNKILTVDFKIQTIHGTGSAVIPYQRWFVIKLKKLNISSVQFVEK